MKKFDLLKVLGISFLVIVVLSWIIPAGMYSAGKFTSLEATIPVGLYDLFRIPALTIATFIQYGLIFLAIGAFYGVISKAGVYSKLVNEFAKKFNKSKGKFLVLTVILFALLSSLFALPVVTFILVPFFVAVLMVLGYNKMTAFTATIGAMLVGQIGNTLGFNLWGYFQVFYELGSKSGLVWRVAILGLLIAAFIVMLKPWKKPKEEKDEKKEIPFMEEKEAKKSTLPLFIVVFLMISMLLLGMYNWYYSFDFDFFTSIHDTIVNYEINGYPIFGNLLGTVSEIGFWNNYDLVTILLIASVLLGWIYSLKFNEILEGMKNGMKKMLPTAFYAMIASVIFATLLNMQSGNFGNTIINTILKGSEDFSLARTLAAGGVMSFLQNDFYTLASNYYGLFASYDKAILPIAAITIQSIYGIVMLVAPTSIFLLAGLRFMEIPYTKWIKHIWKFALVAFAIVAVVLFIALTVI